jgi:hypothetical protein
LDHFGQLQILEWKYVADNGKWNLINHLNKRESQTRENQQPR